MQSGRGALLASKMTKKIYPINPGGRSITQRTRQLSYSPDGKIMKEKIRNGRHQFADGSKQSLYFEPGHPRDGLFKGMTILLEDGGCFRESKLLAQCRDFKCVDKKANCVKRRTFV